MHSKVGTNVRLSVVVSSPGAAEAVAGKTKSDIRRAARLVIMMQLNLVIEFIKVTLGRYTFYKLMILVYGVISQ